MIQDISNRLLGDFSNCLASRLEPAPPAAAGAGTAWEAATGAPAPAGA